MNAISIICLCLSALSTMLLAVFTWRLWISTDKVAEATKTLADSNKSLVEATKQLVDATALLVSENKESSKLQLRAYVNVKNIKANYNVILFLRKMSFTVAVHNRGSTPAYDVTVHAAASPIHEPDKYDMAKFAEFLNRNVFLSKSIIASGSELFTRITMDKTNMRDINNEIVTCPHSWYHLL